MSALAVARQRFLNKFAIVTGGASGIGKATVERLVEEGATVGVFDINKEAGEALANTSPNIHYYSVDVSESEACIQGVSSFIQNTNNSTLNYLVNGAVYFGSKGLEAKRQDWDKSFAVNVIGYANMLQAVYPHMIRIPGSHGKAVVNIASISAHKVQPTRWTYAATKGAITQMTRCMALDVSKENVRVNSVSPAWVWSPEVSKAAGGDREKWEKIWGLYHMPRRFAETSEIASAICFLLSDDASYVTATDLPVEGGYMSMGPEGLGEDSSFAGTDY